MQLSKERLGDMVWCLLKASPVTENEDADYLYHIVHGKVTAVGFVGTADEPAPFCEVGGQRIKAEFVFETHKDCLEYSVKQAETTQQNELPDPK